MHYIIPIALFLIIGCAGAWLFGQIARGGREPDSLEEQAEALRKNK